MNRVTDTAIVNRSYASRGLLPHGARIHNLVRTTKGVLWAAVRERHFLNQINLYRSDDQGFSWENIFRGKEPIGVGWGGELPIRPNERAHGHFISLNVFENLNKVIVWHTFYRSSVSTPYVKIWPFIFNMETGERDLDEVPSNAPDYDLDSDEMAIKVVYNENMIYICYVKDGRFRIRTFQPARITIMRLDSATTQENFVPTFDMSSRKDGLVDVAITTDTEAIQYIRYNDSGNIFTNPTAVATASGKVQDLNIARDSDGVITIAWAEVDGQSVLVRYATSDDDGVNWTVNDLPVPTPYTDKILQEPAARVRLMAGLHDFLMTYTRLKDGLPRTFMRRLTGTFAGPEQEIATQSTPDRAVVGAEFFHPPVAKLLDIEDSQHVRVAYQVDEGNSLTATDTEAVRFGQELLKEDVFAQISLPPPDEPETNQRPINLKIVPGPSENIDYYAEGVIGRHTRRHEASFRRVGTDIRFLCYEPTQHAETDDRAAYGAPTEFVYKAIVSAMSYEAPFAATQDTFTDFIERDARRVHVPPDFHLHRNFVLNSGNYLKRTVWTLFFGGNEYEISQVVPHFMKGQLVHYSANAYVIGVSNDPFSRKILPSET